MNAVATLLLLVALLGMGCQETGDRQAGHNDHAGAHPPDIRAAAVPEDLLVIDREMLRDLRLTTAPVEIRASGEDVTLLGELRVNEERHMEVGSPVVARVMQILVSLGEHVRPGQPLVELQSVELGKTRAEYLAAEARVGLTRQSLQRKRTLGAERIIAQREVQEAEAEAVAAEANFRAAQAALQALGVLRQRGEVSSQSDASRFQLQASIGGTVIERNVIRGQTVDPARPLFLITDLSQLWLIVQAFERDAVRVKTGTAARVTLPALPGRTFSGVVTLVGSQVNTTSRTIPIRIDLTNPEKVLRPGMSATAAVPLGDVTATVMTVPAVALQRIRDGWCVFLPREADRFEIRPVGRGRDLGGEIEIVSGLQPGETVVVDGAFLLKAEVEKSRAEGEHHEH